MQSHWQEPQPLGEAQRNGLMQMSQQRSAQERHEALVRQQIAQQRQQLAAQQQGGVGGIVTGAMRGLHSALGMFGGPTGLLKILAAGGVGYYMGTRSAGAAVPNPGEDEDEGDEDDDEGDEDDDEIASLLEAATNPEGLADDDEESHD